MSFLAALAKQKSVPDWFLKASKDKLDKQEIISKLEAECRAAEECRVNPDLWNDEMITSFANFLFDFYSARLKTK